MTRFISKSRGCGRKLTFCGGMSKHQLMLYNTENCIHIRTIALLFLYQFISYGFMWALCIGEVEIAS